MIEQTILTALAVNFMFQLPTYQRLTSRRNRETILQRTTSREEYDKAYDFYEAGDSITVSVRFLHYSSERGGDPFDYPVHEFYTTKQDNPLHRKPFTCIFCMTFWIATLQYLFIPLIVGKEIVPSVLVTAPFVAEAFSRLYKLIPIKL